MDDHTFPEFIKGLPQVDIALAGVRGWLSQGSGHQIAFFDIQPGVDLPAHTHGEQWGIVVEGEMELTIGGQASVYRRGDSYNIPAGVEHGAKFLTHFRAIDVFADPNRYKPK